MLLTRAGNGTETRTEKQNNYTLLDPTRTKRVVLKDPNRATTLLFGFLKVQENGWLSTNLHVPD